MKYLASMMLLIASFSISIHYNQTSSIPKNRYDNCALEDANSMSRVAWEKLRDPSINGLPSDIQSREHDFVNKLNIANTSRLGWGVNQDSVLAPDPNQLMQHGIESAGGRTRCIAFDISNESILLAGSAGGGMWRSINQGKNWIRTTSDGYIHSVSSLAQDKRIGHRNVWYYGTGETISTGGYPTYTYDIGCGIFKSLDSGKSWQKLPSTSTNRQAFPQSKFHLINNIATNNARLDSDVVYAATNGAILRSSNGGQDWLTVLGATRSDSSVCWTDVTVTTTGLVYASISGPGSENAGIWRSLDGFTWSNINAGSIVGSTNVRMKLCCAPSNPYTLWLYKGDPQNPLFKYTYDYRDGSSLKGRWESRNNYMKSVLQDQGGYCMSLSVSPRDENVILVGATDLYVTKDGFTSENGKAKVAGVTSVYENRVYSDPIRPKLLLYDNSHPDMHECIFLPSQPFVVFIACDGGIYRTVNIFENNQVRWISLNKDYNATQFYSVAMDRVGVRDGIIIGGTQDNNSSVGSRDGRPMRWVLGGDGMISDIGDGHVAFYPSYQNGVLYKIRMNSALDSVMQWTCLNKSLDLYEYQFIAPMCRDPKRDSIFYILGKQFVRWNTNLSEIGFTNTHDPVTKNWRQLDVDQYITSDLSSIGVSPTHKSRMYLGTSNGKILRVDDALTSWPKVTVLPGTELPNNGYINNIAVDPNDGNDIFAVFSNYGIKSIFHSTNAGDSWECVAGNLEEFDDGTGAGPAVRWLDILHFENRTMYIAGTTSGVFTTNELSGVSTVWKQFSGVPNVNVDMVRVRSTDGFIAIATHGLGIYTTYATMNNSSGALNVSDPANSMAPVRCFPNPTNGTISLKYNCQSTQPITIELYNSNGLFVRNIATKEGLIGECVISTNCTDLPQGSYVVVFRRPDGRTLQTCRFVRS